MQQFLQAGMATNISSAITTLRR